MTRWNTPTARNVFCDYRRLDGSTATGDTKSSLFMLFTGWFHSNYKCRVRGYMHEYDFSTGCLSGNQTSNQFKIGPSTIQKSDRYLWTFSEPLIADYSNLLKTCQMKWRGGRKGEEESISLQGRKPKHLSRGGDFNFFFFTRLQGCVIAMPIFRFQK